MNTKHDLPQEQPLSVLPVTRSPKIIVRIWDKEDRIMIIDPHLSVEYGELKVNYPAREILTKWIGKNDVANKKIFEGDIVRWDDGSNGTKWRVAVVEMNPDIRFRVVRINDPMIQSAREGHVFRYGSFIYTDTEKYLEVIGNIFEDTHLFATD